MPNKGVQSDLRQLTPALRTNMNFIPKICTTLIAISLVIFFATFYHYQGILENEVKLSSVVAEAASAFNSAPVYDEPSFVPGRYGITEERSVFLLFALAALFSLSAAATAVAARLKNGPFQSFVAITLCSLCVIGSIAYTAYLYGLDTYA